MYCKAVVILFYSESVVYRIVRVLLSNYIVRVLSDCFVKVFSDCFVRVLSYSFVRVKMYFCIVWVLLSSCIGRVLSIVLERIVVCPIVL